MGQFAIGQAVPREEDPRLLRGEGEYHRRSGAAAHGVGHVLRSPHAHARIAAIDTRAAQQMPGVLGVFTEADLKADGIGTMQVPHAEEAPGRLADVHQPASRPRARRDAFRRRSRRLCRRRNARQAKDAAEAIEVTTSRCPRWC